MNRVQRMQTKNRGSKCRRKGRKGRKTGNRISRRAINHEEAVCVSNRWSVWSLKC